MGSFLQVDITFEGGPSQLKKILTMFRKTYPDAMMAAAHEANIDLAELIIEDIEKTINTPYPPASRPGRPPHRRSGDLQDSYEYEAKAGGRLSKPRMRVFSTVDYSGYLEFGTRTMSPRPHMRPAIQRQAKNYEKLYRAHFASKTRGAA